MAVSKKQRETDVEALLKRAEDYAASAVEGVLERLEEDPRRPNRLFRHYARLVLALEVHFLFPNFTPAQRRVLVDLLQTRNALEMRRAGPHVGGKSGPWARALVPWERKYQRLRTRVSVLARGRGLTQVQRTILRRVFLRVFSAHTSAG